jgi:hypothetical protein
MTQLAGGQFIKSIQNISQTKNSIDMSASELYDYDYSGDGYSDVSSLSNSIFIPSPVFVDTNSADSRFCYAYLQAAGNIRVQCYNGLASCSIYIEGALIEFAGGVIKSKQEGTINIASGDTGTAAITAVDLAKSIVFDQGKISSYTSYAYTTSVADWGFYLSSTTQVTLRRKAIDALNVTGRFCVIEFQHL